jgi:hypothetical protein
MNLYEAASNLTRQLEHALDVLLQFDQRQHKMKGIFLRLGYLSRNKDVDCRMEQLTLCVF